MDKFSVIIPTIWKGEKLNELLVNFYNSDFINSTYWTYIIKPKIKPKMNELVFNL